MFVGLNLDQVLFILLEKSVEHRVPADTEVALICFQYEGLKMNCVVGA